ncbi:hypothetical protein LWI28_006730 [Acer negundo]|uniref:Uncharacterized protein n=1 Tax=Acer negundo TaxID=4023 RepID=A0AAD5P175_ACENE|nr:hypothetical protein LWI28_006730 [Acer negundo]
MANEDRKVDAISNDLRQLLDTLGVTNGNLRNRGPRAPVRHGNQASSVGIRDQRRARRHENPVPPKFSESDDGGIPHRRPTIGDSDTNEDTENWILGGPRFNNQHR